jgi:cellulose biosynthesis protein BcsQ
VKIIAVYSIKGGVGKTATSVNLSYLAAREGFSSILCDLDPQGSASYYFRVRAGKKFNQKKFLQGGKAIDKNIKGTDFPNLDLLPSDLSFRNLDVTLGNFKNAKNKLKDLLTPLQEEYDYVFLDCPPNITLVSENVFRAADHILVPCIPTTLSIRTLGQLIKFFKEKDLSLKKIKAFFSMVEGRKRMHQDSISKIAENKKITCFLKSQIPYLAEVEKMGLTREPVAHTNPKSPAALAYESLWQEIKEK